MQKSYKKVRIDISIEKVLKIEKVRKKPSKLLFFS